MFLEKGRYPFEGYNVYLYYNKQLDRNLVSLLPDKDHVNTLKRTFMLYSRYLMCIKEGRILDYNETVDHIDNNRHNDSIENLQIISRSDNVKKQMMYKPKHNVYLRCPWCGKKFFKIRCRTFLSRKNNTFTACSRSCSARFGYLCANFPDDPRVIYGLQHNVLLEYKVQIRDPNSNNDII